MVWVASFTHTQGTPTLFGEALTENERQTPVSHSVVVGIQVSGKVVRGVETKTYNCFFLNKNYTGLHLFLSSVLIGTPERFQRFGGKESKDLEEKSLQKLCESELKKKL